MLEKFQNQRIVTDSCGKKHICLEAGTTEFVTLSQDTSTSLEEEVCEAAKKASICDFNSNELIAKREPGGNTYMVQGGSSFCFVRPLGEGMFEVKLNDWKMPFEVGADCRMRAFSGWKTTIFWYTTPEEKTASHYYSVEEWTK